MSSKVAGSRSLSESFLFSLLAYLSTPTDFLSTFLLLMLLELLGLSSSNAASVCCSPPRWRYSRTRASASIPASGDSWFMVPKITCITWNKRRRGEGRSLGFRASPKIPLPKQLALPLKSLRLLSASRELSRLSRPQTLLAFVSCQ